MRLFANVVVIFFLLDGTLTLVDEMLSTQVDLNFPSLLRGTVRILTIFYALLAYSFLAISPRLPKRIIMPLTFFCVWILFSGMPLPLYLGFYSAGIIVSICQVFAGLIILFVIRRSTKEKSCLFKDSSLEGRSFSIRNSLLFIGCNLFIVLPILLLYLYSCITLTVNKLTNGFFHIGLKGLYAEERIYTRGNQTIHLLGMIHIGEKNFYEGIISSLPTEGSIILAEGVSDTNNLIKSVYSYKNPAAKFGLEAQENFSFKKGQKRINADLDTRDFSPFTLAVLNAVSKLNQATDLKSALELSYDIPDEMGTAEGIQTLKNELVHLRNKKLLEHLRSSLTMYKRVIVPWGALHMPELEAQILEYGFEFSKRNSRRCIRFFGSPKEKEV